MSAGIRAQASAADPAMSKSCDEYRRNPGAVQSFFFQGNHQ
jgi:hypothetical protein